MQSLSNAVLALPVRGLARGEGIASADPQLRAGVEVVDLALLLSLADK